MFQVRCFVAYFYFLRWAEQTKEKTYNDKWGRLRAALSELYPRTPRADMFIIAWADNESVFFVNLRGILEQSPNTPGNITVYPAVSWLWKWRAVVFVFVMLFYMLAIKYTPHNQSKPAVNNQCARSLSVKIRRIGWRSSLSFGCLVI